MVLIIALGIYIIIKHRQHPGTFHNINTDPGNPSTGNFKYKEGYIPNVDRLDDVSIFGGGHKYLSSDNFQGGNITAIFGGSEIDLTRCKLAPGNNVIEVVAIFGGTTIIIPKEWNVIIDVLPIFGSFSHKGMRWPGVTTDPENSLIIKGTMIFGGGEIKTY